MMISLSKLKIRDYSHKVINNEITLRKGTRVLVIYCTDNIFFIDDSLLHQSDCHICESEEELIKLIEKLCND